MCLASGRSISKLKDIFKCATARVGSAKHLLAVIVVVAVPEQACRCGAKLADPRGARRENVQSLT